MQTPEKMLEAFYDLAKSTIQSDGEYTMPCAIWRNREEGTLQVEALDLGAQGVMLHCINTIDGGKCSAMIFGIDMASKPDQGLEFADFVLVFEWQAERPEPLRDQLRIGVINYRRGDDPVIRPIDWDNTFWKANAFNLVGRFIPIRFKVTKTDAAAS